MFEKGVEIVETLNLVHKKFGFWDGLIHGCVMFDIWRYIVYIWEFGDYFIFNRFIILK